jgi:hypothetical protein
MHWASWLLLMVLSTVRGVLMIIFTVVLFGGVLSTIVMLALGRGPVEVAVPNVVNVPCEQAQQTMEAAGLRLDVSREVFNPEVGEGNIITTRPAAGKLTRQGRKVFALVSMGSEEAVVPKVVGHNMHSAQQRLSEARLTVGTVVYKADSNPRDHVLQQTPVADSTVSRNHQVHLVLSGGPDFGRQQLAGGRTLVFRTARLVVPQGEPLQRIMIKVVSTERKFEKVFYSRVHRPSDEVVADFYAPENARLQVLVDSRQP